MKYYFTPKPLDMKKCPVCKKTKIYNINLICDNCRQAFDESEKNLTTGEWVGYNVWRRRLRFVPFGRKIVEKFKIYNFEGAEDFIPVAFLGFVGVIAILETIFAISNILSLF